MSLKLALISTAGRMALAAETLFRPRRSANPQSLLILEYLLPLGYCVHLTPLYEALKHSCPHLTLAVATRGLAASVLRHNPNIDHLIETPDALVDTLGVVRHLRAELRRRNLQPDLTFTGASDRRTRIALLAFLASPARRAGFTLAPDLYHQPLDYNPALSLIDNNLRLAPLAGCSRAHREPTVFFSPADLAVARTLVAQVNPDSKPLLILVTQPSGGQSTGWHQDRFAEVARHASEALGFAVAFVGIPADREPIERIRAAATQAGEATGALAGTNLAGRTSVTELAALLALSDYLVSLDTGTMHVGRAAGIPLVVLGPSWQKPLEWLPIDIPSARILRGPDVDAVPPNYKLDEITALHVLTALEDLLTAYPPSAEARAARIERSLSSIDHLQPPPASV